MYCHGEQAAQLSKELADLQGQNQNERLAVPLLRLAGAVQAALTWQHKVRAASLSCPLLLPFPVLCCFHFLPFATCLSSLALPTCLLSTCLSPT